MTAEDDSGVYRCPNCRWPVDSARPSGRQIVGNDERVMLAPCACIFNTDYLRRTV